MSDKNDSLGRFLMMAEAITKVTEFNKDLLDSIIRDTREIEKLNDIIDELRDENERLKREAKGGEA